MAERPTDPIRKEHEALRQHVEHLREVADKLGRKPDHVETPELQGVFDWLVTELLPHASSEEKGLYLLADKIIARHGRASATMCLDHAFIKSKVHAFGETVSAIACGARAGSSES